MKRSKSYKVEGIRGDQGENVRLISTRLDPTASGEASSKNDLVWSSTLKFLHGQSDNDCRLSRWRRKGSTSAAGRCRGGDVARMGVKHHRIMAAMRRHERLSETTGRRWMVNCRSHQRHLVARRRSVWLVSEALPLKGQQSTRPDSPRDHEVLSPNAPMTQYESHDSRR